jgi:galactose mutarotase-like enzyme
VATLFGRTISRRELERRIGDLSQVAGVRLMRLQGGREEGVRIADVRTGSGLRFQMTLDRGMDISLADYRGVPLAWRSGVGDAHPAYFDGAGTGWLRTFPGGLLTGCGMTYLGAPCLDEGQALGLHGRLSHIPAENVSVRHTWEGDECTFTLSGEMRETAIFAENLLLRRTVKFRLGSSALTIDDTVRNDGSLRTPFMMLYHINPGWPVVDEGSRLLLNSKGAVPRDAEAEKGVGEALRFSAPVRGYREQVFSHELAADAAGFAAAALVNEEIGLGLSLRYRQRELPRYTEWKMMGERDYVVGMEPANCGVRGRGAERSARTLQHLEPGEEWNARLEIGVLDGAGEIGRFATDNSLR